MIKEEKTRGDNNNNTKIRGDNNEIDKKEGKEKRGDNEINI